MNCNSLRQPNEAVIGKDTTQLLCDGTTIELFVLAHNDEVFGIEQDAEVVFSNELSGGHPDVYSILCLSVRIPTRPRGKFGEPIDESIMSFVTMPDHGSIRNA